MEYTGITGSPENKKPWKKADLPCREGRLEACLPEAASRLTALTRNHVIITLGAHGAFHMEPSGKHALIPGCPARQVDATGAGDSHMGAVIACRMKGFPMDKAIRTANRISAAVVEHAGAGLEDEDFLRLNA